VLQPDGRSIVHIQTVQVSTVPLILPLVNVIFTFKSMPGVRVILSVEDGRVTSYLIEGQVSARAFQRIPLRTLEREAVKQVAAEGRGDWGERPDFICAKAATLVPPGDTKEGPLVLLAVRYLELCLDSGAPTKALAKELHQSVGTVRDQLAEARRRGLLLSAGPGRPGGELTTKATKMLSARAEA
jgi:hypothetical protein